MFTTFKVVFVLVQILSLSFSPSLTSWSPISGVSASEETPHEAPHEDPTTHCQKDLNRQDVISHNFGYAWVYGQAQYMCIGSGPSPHYFSHQYVYDCDMSATNGVQNVLVIGDKIQCSPAKWSNTVTLPAATVKISGTIKTIEPSFGCVKGPLGAVLDAKSVFVTGWAHYVRPASPGSNSPGEPRYVKLNTIYAEHVVAPTSKTDPDHIFFAFVLAAQGQSAANWQICGSHSNEFPISLEIAFLELPEGFDFTGWR